MTFTVWSRFLIVFDALGSLVVDVPLPIGYVFAHYKPSKIRRLKASGPSRSSRVAACADLCTSPAVPGRVACSDRALELPPAGRDRGGRLRETDVADELEATVAF